MYVKFTQSPSVVIEWSSKVAPTDNIEPEPIQLDNVDLIVETHKKGFVVGTQREFGFFNIYQISKEFEVTLIQSFRFANNCLGINSMSISFDRSYLVLSAKLLDQNIEDQLEELKMREESTKSHR